MEITIDNIIIFLKQNGLIWQGKIYDQTTCTFRYVTPNDLNDTSTPILLELTDDYIYLDLKNLTIKNVFTNEDIASFIGEQIDLYWDGKIYNNSLKKASENDFLPKKSDCGFTRKVSLEVFDVKNNNKKDVVTVEVSNTDFKKQFYEHIHAIPFDESFSIKWQEMLLETHTELYAPIYIDTYRKKCKQLIDSAPRQGFIKKKPKIQGNRAILLEEYRQKINNAINLQKNYDASI